MILLGPDGGNLEVGSTDLTFHGKEGVALLVPFDQILSVKIIDGNRLEACFTDLNEDYLKIKRISQIASDGSALQNVYDMIQVTGGVIQMIGGVIRFIPRSILNQCFRWFMFSMISFFSDYRICSI